MIRQPEIVVGRKEDEPLAVDLDLGVGGATDRHQTAKEADTRDLVELGAKLGVELGNVPWHRPEMRRRRRLVNATLLGGFTR